MVGRQTTMTAVQSGAGLMIPDLGHQRRQRVGRDVRRVAQHQIKTPEDRFRPIAAQEGRAGRKPQIA